MMNIKVLGTGCAKCLNLEKLCKEVITENEIDAEVEKVKDIQEIMKYGILSTPGLIINEKVVSYGTVPSKEKILEMLKQGS